MSAKTQETQVVQSSLELKDHFYTQKYLSSYLPLMGFSHGDRFSFDSETEKLKILEKQQLLVCPETFKIYFK